MMASDKNDGKYEIENVRVVIRVRPLNKKEQSEGYQNIISINRDENVIALSKPNLPNEEAKTFKFDYIFPEDCTQMDLYGHVASPIVEKVLEGYNGTVIAYGQTGTGKTYTMVGKQNSFEHSGIIPNTFSHIFNQISSLSTEKIFVVTATYLEIYNEDVRDLLSTNQNCKLEVRERLDVGVYVKDLMGFTVDSIDSITELMNRGNNNRMTRSTLMNDVSSRSHAIFTISIESRDKIDGKTTTGKLNLVDLAGSERLGRTRATGDRLKEASNINQSLSVLGNVISALANEKSTHIPFRNSKLTRLLQDSLGGNSKTAMIAMVGPSEVDYEESLCTLRYASRAKFIKNQVHANVETKQEMIESMKQEVAKLQRWISLMTLNEDMAVMKSEPTLKLTLLRNYDAYSSSLEARNMYLENQCTHLLEQLRNCNQASIRQKQENDSQINKLKAQDDRISILLKQICELSRNHSSLMLSSPNQQFSDLTPTNEESMKPKLSPSTDKGLESMFTIAVSCQTDEYLIGCEEVSRSYEKLLTENEDLKDQLEESKLEISELEKINLYIHNSQLIEELCNDVHKGNTSNSTETEEIIYLNHQLQLSWPREHYPDVPDIDYEDKEIVNRPLEVIIQDLKGDAELGMHTIDPEIFEERILKSRHDKDIKILENRIVRLNATVKEYEKEIEAIRNQFQELSVENLRVVADNKKILREKSVLQLKINEAKETLLATEGKLETAEDNLLELNEELTRLERNNALNKLQMQNDKLVVEVTNLKKSGEFFENYYGDKIKTMWSSINSVDHPIVHELINSRNKSKSDGDLTSKENFTTATSNSLNNLCASTDFEHIYFTDLYNGLVQLRSLLQNPSLPLLQTEIITDYEEIIENYKNKYIDDTVQTELTKANAKINELTTNCQRQKELIGDLLNNKVNLEKLNWSLDDRLEILMAEKNDLIEQLQTSKKTRLCHPNLGGINPSDETKSLRSKIVDFEEQAKSATKNYEAEKATYEIIQLELRKEKENNLSVQTERDMLLKTIADYTINLKILKEANDSLNVDKKVLEQQCDKIVSQNESLQAKIDRVTEESQQMYAQILTKKRLVNEQNELITKLSAENNDLKMANDECSKTIKILDERNQDLQVKIDGVELKATEESRRTNAEILTNKRLVNEQSELITKLYAKTDDLTKANYACSKTIKILGEQNRDLQMKKDAAELKATEQSQRMCERSKLITMLSAKNDDMKMANDEGSKTIKMLDERNQDLQVKIGVVELKAAEESRRMSAEILTNKRRLNEQSELITKLYAKNDDLTKANYECSETIKTLDERNQDLQVKKGAMELELENFNAKVNGLKHENRLLETKLQTTLEELKLEKTSHVKFLESNELMLLNNSLEAKNKVLNAKIKSQQEDFIKEKATVDKYKKELLLQHEFGNKREEIIYRLKAECAEVKNLKSELKLKDSEIQGGTEKIKLLTNKLEESGNIALKLKLAEAKLNKSLNNEKMLKFTQQSNRIELNTIINQLEYAQYIVQKNSSHGNQPSLASMLSNIRTSLASVVNAGEPMAAQTDAHQLLPNLQVTENEVERLKLQISEVNMKYNDVTKELNAKCECETSTSNKRKKRSPQTNARDIECEKCVQLSIKIHDLEAHMNTPFRTNHNLEFFRNQCNYQTNTIKELEMEKRTLEAQLSELSKAQETNDLENEHTILKDKYNKVKAIARLRMREIQELQSRLGHGNQ